jgi:hypothetical protein
MERLESRLPRRGRPDRGAHARRRGLPPAPGTEGCLLATHGRTTATSALSWLTPLRGRQDRLPFSRGLPFQAQDAPRDSGPRNRAMGII